VTSIEEFFRKTKKRRLRMKKLIALLAALAVLAACAPATPEVVEKEVVVEKPVVQTVVVEKEKVVEKPVVETVVVEKPVVETVEVEKVVKETVVVEKVVTPEAVKISRELIGEYEGPTMITDPAKFPTKFQEAPELADLVAKGELPPVEERLPVREDLMVWQPLDEIGVYGGVWRKGFTGPGDVWIAYRTGCDNPLFRDVTFKKIVPNVLKDCTMSEDGTTYDLFLRRGMRWSDGAPFTADDWMFWYEDVLNNPDFGYSDPYFMAKGGEQGVMEKVDDYHVRITFASSYPFFYELMSTRYGASSSGGRAGLYLPKHYLSQFHAKYIGAEEAKTKAAAEGYDNWVLWFRAKGTWNTNPDMPTLQPWKMVTTANNPVWIFERNPYYWAVDTAGNQLPYIDRVEHTLATNTEVMNLRAIAGEYDWQEATLALSNLPIFLEYADKGGYKVYLDPGDYGTESQFRVNQNYTVDPYIGEWYRNTDFRRALSLGINRQEINDVFFLGLGVCGSPIPSPDNPYYPGDEYRTLWHTYEPDKANAMLDELGLDKKDSEGFRVRTDNGKRLTLQAVTQAGMETDWTGICEMIKEQWLDIGIDLDVKEVDRSIADAWEASGEIQLYVWNNDGSEDLFTSKKVLPTTSGSVFARDWAAWYLSGGKKGEEPPEYMQEALAMYKAGCYASPEERIRLGKEIWKIHVDYVLSIGTVGVVPGANAVRVVNANMRNVPERVYNSPLARHPSIVIPPTFFFAH